MERLLYWLWLQKSLGFGADISGIVRYFGSAQALYEADEDELRTSGFFGNDLFEIEPKKIVSMKKTPLSYGEPILNECERLGITVLTPEDRFYPAELKKISNFPAVLFVKGDLSCLEGALALGVVGTRRPSVYGLEAADKLASQLAKNGAVIVSGGALGIDSAAHTAAIKSGGKTVLVMGCGHESGYLPENEPLRSKVCENGAVITEYPPHTSAAPYYFPMRNRLISGISRGIVVIEAGEKSGTLNTARHARQQGKDIFAVPGDVSSLSYSGSNKLIVEGAKAVFSAGDILDFYEVEKIALDEISENKEKPPFFGIDEFPDYGANPKKKQGTKKAKSQKTVKSAEKDNEKDVKKFNFDIKTVSKNAQLVYNQLLSGKTVLDEITRGSGLPVRKVLVALTELEMAGAVVSLAGNRYKTTD